MKNSGANSLVVWLQKEVITLSPASCGVLLKGRELALQKQMPGPSGASGVEGPASAPPQYPPSLVARWQRPGTKGARLGRAFAWASGTLAFSLRRVIGAFSDISFEALACGGVGVRGQRKMWRCPCDSNHKMAIWNHKVATLLLLATVYL